jgi:hypothetical protein
LPLLAEFDLRNENERKAENREPPAGLRELSLGGEVVVRRLGFDHAPYW